MGTLNIGIIGAILGFYGDNGKENGNYYIGAIYTLLIPFLGTLFIMCRIIIGIQKGAIISTTTQIGFWVGRIHSRHPSFKGTCPVLVETQVGAGFGACSPQSDSQRNGCDVNVDFVGHEDEAHNGAGTGEVGDTVTGAAGAVLV